MLISMEGESKKHSQRVVLVHDTSGGVKTNNALKWIIDEFKLKAGDTFTFLLVIHQIQHPMGYKIRVDNSMLGGTNESLISDEIARKRNEYYDDNNLELCQLSQLYQLQKIDFKFEFFVGPIPKNAAVEASKQLKATWVILDRKMKHKNYFLEKLSCGVSGLKRNGEIIKIRGPKMSARVYKRKLLYGKRLHVDNKFQNRENEDLFSTNFDSSYLLTTAYESIEQAPSIGCMVGNRGNSEIGSVDFSYDAPPSYNDVAPRDRSQTYEYPRHSGVQNHLRDLTNTSDANQRKKKKITTMMDNNIHIRM